MVVQAKLESMVMSSEFVLAELFLV